MSAGFDNIAFDDSYLLGWSKSSETVEFYAELLLTDQHPLFEPYDEEAEHGCYKKARIVVDKVVTITGLPYDQHQVKWNERSNEYDDVAEIDSLIVIDNTIITITAEEMTIEIRGGAITLEFS